MNKWTKDEIKILRQNYGELSVKEIHENHLPHRSIHAIRGQAGRLELSIPWGRDSNNSYAKISDGALLQELGRRGYASTKRKMPVVDETYVLEKPLEPIEIGVVSDPQLGNKHQQISHLNHFYDLCDDRSIQTMVNCGDIVDGNGRVYRGQIYDLFLHGSDAQVDYTVKNYPKRKGMVTYHIGGNHDESWYKSEGTEILKRVNERRDDLPYLGMYGAHLKLGDIKLYLMHSDGGVAYARSYKLQKIIEQMSPQSKPHILLAGHWHVASHLPMYRNVEGFSLGCFQAQTSYLRRKGLYPTIAGLILKIYPDEKGLKGIDTHWEYYHVPIENDF